MNQTGPTTPEGKARSSMNATKHGLTAMNMILPGVENEEDWQTFYQDVVDYYEPVGAVECAFVDRAAALMWRLRRVPRAERDATLNAAAEDAEPAHLRAMQELCNEQWEIWATPPYPLGDDPAERGIDVEAVTRARIDAAKKARALALAEMGSPPEYTERQPRSLAEPATLLPYSKYEARLDGQLRHLHREIQRCRILREQRKVVALNAL